MTGLIINCNKNMYEFNFDSNSISNIKELRVDIHLTSLEHWNILYQLISNREKKVDLIEKYLQINRVKNIHLINRALMKDLPSAVKKQAQLLLN